MEKLKKVTERKIIADHALQIETGKPSGKNQGRSGLDWKFPPCLRTYVGPCDYTAMLLPYCSLWASFLFFDFHSICRPTEADLPDSGITSEGLPDCSVNF